LEAKIVEILLYYIIYYIILYIILYMILYYIILKEIEMSEESELKVKDNELNKIIKSIEKSFDLGKN